MNPIHSDPVGVALCVLALLWLAMLGECYRRVYRARGWAWMRRLVAGLGYLPAFALVMFVVFMARVRLDVGFWPERPVPIFAAAGAMPTYVRVGPDPMDYGVHTAVAALSCIAAFASLVLYVPLAVGLSLERAHRWRWTALYVAGYAALCTVARLDPWGSVDWFLG